MPAPVILPRTLAVEAFAHRVRRYLGAFLVQVAPCDGVIFGAYILELTCGKCHTGWLA